MRFKYLGEQPREYVTKYGPTTVISYSRNDGSFVSLRPIPPATQFVVGDDIGYDIVDPRGIQVLSIDPRFQKIS